MGSDMSMEIRNHIARPPRIEWDDDELVVYHDLPISGWSEKWRGKPNLRDKTVVDLLKFITHGQDIPPKPISIGVKIGNILVAFRDGRVTKEEAVRNIKEITK